jgi:MFS family permease
MRRMLAACAVNELGNWFGYVALALATYDHTHSAIATAAFFIARSFLPALLAPVLVVRLERSPSRGTLAAVYLVEAMLALALAVMLLHFWLPGVLALVALDGVAAIAGTALIRAAGNRIAEEDEDGELGTRRANASLNVVFMLAFAIGPAIGGALVDSVGGSRTLTFAAATFLASGLLLLDTGTYVESDTQGSIRQSLTDAWQYVQRLPVLRALLITEAIALALFASAEPVEVIYAKTTLSGGNLGLGLLLACWGGGAAAGAIFFARTLERSLARMLVLGTLLAGVAFIGFAAAPSIGVACIIAVVGGVGNGIQWPALIAAVQALTPSTLQGRLMSAVGSMGALAPNVGYAIGGTIAVLSSTRTAMLFAGALATATTLGFARIALSGAIDLDRRREQRAPEADAPPAVGEIAQR